MANLNCTVNENTAADDDDWCVSCSDSEILEGSTWEPSPQEIVELYETLDEGRILELEWQCPGRRSPSVPANESDNGEGRQLDEDEKKGSEPNEFDFEDELTATPSSKITPRRRHTPASSTKRVASMDKVLFDIQRYKKLDEQQKLSASPPLPSKTLES